MRAYGDHPRVCGEKTSTFGWQPGNRGSPPRMRGKDVDRYALELQQRITPAYAGKSTSTFGWQPGNRGSPPRMRGKGLPQGHRGRDRGITPAYAGKSRQRGRGGRGRQDHPRVCGEKPECPPGTPSCAKSPPRMRGKAINGVSQRKDRRITPAYAGKSAPDRPTPRRPADHPRVCGEKFLCIAEPVCGLGSPPRMRGKVTRLYALADKEGITPAYAGKRLKRSRSTVPHAAIVPLFPSVCNKPAGSDGSPAGHDAPPFLPLENAAPASPAYNLRFL